MLKLADALSHGPGSSWIEHTEQVLSAALTSQEAIGVICHDIPKLTIPWQDRAGAFHGFGSPVLHPDGSPWPSPHQHAAWGAAFAYLILKKLYPKLVLERFAIYHAVAAHHSGEGVVRPDNDRFKIIACPQVCKLAFEALCYFRVPISRPVFNRIWKAIPDAAEEVFKEGQNLSLPNIKTIWEDSRKFLGRLVLFDVRSAKDQDPATRHPFNPALPDGVTFAPRVPKSFPQNRLANLRNLVATETLKLVDYDLITIAAPTGGAKTEAYIKLAEAKVKQGGYEKIIIALPMISILEQILDDYFTQEEPGKKKVGQRVAQIWNYLIQAKADEYLEFKENNAAIISTILSSPFSSPYNITTFNQVFSAIVSPHRHACIRGLCLKNAVIVLDEVQKIPFHALVYGLPLIQEYCQKNNCCLILSSATPLPSSQALFVSKLPKSLPPAVHHKLFSDPLLMNRRTYTKLAPQDDVTLCEIVRQSIAQGKREFFLLSLVARGTFAIAQILGLNSDPFERITKFVTSTGEHPVVWLDGTVPPFLRIQYLHYIRDRLQSGMRITLLTTQVVEAGVDFGGTCFENGYTDFIDLASLLQRGGRVNREGVLPAASLFVFNFLVDLENTTKSVLNRLQINLTEMGRAHATDKVKRLIVQAQTLADNYFDNWNVGNTRNEVRLNRDNDAILSDLFNNRRTGLDDLIQLSPTEDEGGFTLQFMAMVSDLYPSDDEESYLVFGSTADMLAAVQKIQNPTGQTEQELSQHRTRIPQAVVADMCTHRNFRINRPNQSEEILLYRI